MVLGILIGLAIALFVSFIFSAVGEASKMMLYEGERFKLVAGRPNTCRHNLEAGQKLNGMEFRPCHWCDNVYISVNDLLRVQYDTQA